MQIPQDIKNEIERYVTDLRRIEVCVEIRKRLLDGFLGSYLITSDYTDYIDSPVGVIQMYDIFGHRLTSRQLFAYIAYPLHLQLRRTRRLRRKTTHWSFWNNLARFPDYNR